MYRDLSMLLGCVIAYSIFKHGFQLLEWLHGWLTLLNMFVTRLCPCRIITLMEKLF